MFKITKPKDYDELFSKSHNASNHYYVEFTVKVGGREYIKADSREQALEKFNYLIQKEPKDLVQDIYLDTVSLEVRKDN